MKRNAMIGIRAVAAALAGTALTAASAPADEHRHSRPAGFEAERADTGEERARDRNGDGTVCVKDTDQGSEIRRLPLIHGVVAASSHVCRRWMAPH